MKRLTIGMGIIFLMLFSCKNIAYSKEGDQVGTYYRYNRVIDIPIDTDEQIEEEIRLGEMELLAQLIEAEAGNQDMKGKRLVGDVVMNRCKMFGQSVEEVIFSDYQFSCIRDGGFEKSGWNISIESFEAARLAYEGDTLDSEIIFFTYGRYNEYCTPMYKYGDHYFGK